METTNRPVVWIDVADKAENQRKELILLLKKYPDSTKTLVPDILKLFDVLCKIIMFFPFLTSEEYTKLFPYINYTIYRIIKRVFDFRPISRDVDPSSFYLLVISILTSIFKVCNFDLDRNFIDVLTNLDTSFDETKYEGVTIEIEKWFTQQIRIINRQKGVLNAKIQANKELDELDPGFVYSMNATLQNKQALLEAFSNKKDAELKEIPNEMKTIDMTAKTSIISILDSPSDTTAQLIRPHITCIIQVNDSRKTSPLSSEDYDNIFTIISKKQVTQACCDKYISEILDKDKQIVYGSPANILPSETQGCETKEGCNIMGGRKTRKLNKNKLKRTKRHRKKTNRRIPKKQRKTHKRR